jgi:serine/threonine-protein kinase RsbW
MGFPPETRKIVIPSSLNEALRVQQELVDAAQARGYSDHAIFAIRLALDEALSNAVRHGNRNDPSKTVTVEYTINEDELRVTIEDEGPGFDPDCLPDPTLDENLERPCGRGVMLIRAYMTEVVFNAKGNRVTMVKQKTCKLPAV